MKTLKKQKLNNTLMPWIGRIAKMFGSINQGVFKEKGIDINKEQLLILKHLVIKDGLVQNDLAHITEKDKTTLTRLINKMEEKSLLKRVQSEEDNRCNRIFITDLGKEKFTNVFPVLVENTLKVQEDLTKEEIETTIKVLEKITNKIKIIYNETK